MAGGRRSRRKKAKKRQVLTGLHIKGDGLRKMKRANALAAKRQAQAEERYAEHTMQRNGSLQQLLLEKVEQRTYGGPYNLLMSFRKFDNDTTDGKAQIYFDEFNKCLEKFGINGLPMSLKKRLFDSYDKDNSGSISFKEFVDGVMNSRAEHNMLKESMDHFAFLKNDRAKREQNVKQLQREKWKTLSVNVERLLMKKLQEKTTGGPYSILRTFRKFDTDGHDNVIDFTEFKECLRCLGILGVHDDDVRKLFDKYDEDGSGSIQIDEFARGVMQSYAAYNSVELKKGGLEKMKRAREVAEARRQHAMQRYMKNTLRVDVEKILLDKIEQKMEGGPGGLRRAFRKFDVGAGRDGMISFPEFRSALQHFGRVF